MRKCIKYFVWAVAGQIGLMVLFATLLSITRSDLFGWIFVIYFAIPSAIVREITGTSHYEGTVLPLMAISLPFIIVAVVVASFACIIARHRQKISFH